VCGLALFALVMQHAIRPLLAAMDEPGMQVAFVHSAFNLTASGLALLLLPWLWSRIERFVPKV
jgi:Na+/phosphate symporter